MASTYSALKIELIGTGEQSGTWGATTNLNLGDAALGEAITGSANVAFSTAADVTITLTDTNATQTARNLRLNLTESGAGIGYAGNLILGSGCQIKKLYLVNNNTTASKTIKNTTGTGVSIPANSSAFVYNDATNVIQAISAFGGTASVTLPTGTTAQRTVSPANGMIRYNTSLMQYEGYSNGAWGLLGGSGNGTLFSDTITATQGQTVINIPISYVLGGYNLSVYVNGSRQIYNVNYTETSTTSFTFSTGLNVGDLVNYTIGASTSLSINAASVLYNEGGTGAVARNVEQKLQETISVEDFGADSTGVTDSTTAIQNAINAAYTAGQQIVAYGTFKVSSKIVIKGDTDFSQATFNVYGTPAIAVEVSTGSGANPTTILNNSVIWLPKRIENMTKPATGWAGQGIGVRTVNLYSCQIFVGNVVNFATGLQVTSYNQNNAYNNYYLGHLENNQVNIQLIPGNAAGSANENTFIGGRCSHYSGEGTNIAGTRQILINKGTNPVNNNIFIRCSLEGDTAEYHLECGGSTNTFQQCRWEATTPKVYYLGDNSNQGTGNVILYGYGVDNIVYTYSGATSGSYNDAYGNKEKYISVGSSAGIGLTQTFSSGYPIHSYYYAGTKPETASSTEWAVQHGSQYLYGKRPGDTYGRLLLNYVNGGIGFTNGTVAPVYQIFSGGSTDNVYVQNAVGFVPYPDNTIKLGSAGYRWTTVYATTGTINTSDANQKQQIRDLSDSEKQAALGIKASLKAFKFNDAVEAKGDKARIHIGVIAQEVKEIFAVVGLDADDYGLFCSDVLEDGSTSLGVRYEELLAFVIAAL